MRAATTASDGSSFHSFIDLGKTENWYSPSTVLKRDLDTVSEDDACRLGVGVVAIERHGPRAGPSR